MLNSSYVMQLGPVLTKICNAFWIFKISFPFTLSFTSKLSRPSSPLCLKILESYLVFIHKWNLSLCEHLNLDGYSNINKLDVISIILPLCNQLPIVVSFSLPLFHNWHQNDFFYSFVWMTHKYGRGEKFDESKT